MQNAAIYLKPDLLWGPGRSGMALALMVLLAVAFANSTAPKEHEHFYDFLMYTTQGKPRLRQYLVRKMLLHISTAPWRFPHICPAPNRPLRRGRQGIDELKVVVLITTPLRAFEWRQMVRKTLPELTSKLGDPRTIARSFGRES